MKMYLWSFAGSVVACSMEWFFLKVDSYWKYFPIVLVGALLINYSIFRLMRESQSILASVIVFSFSNMVLRTAATLIVRRPVPVGTWVAFGLIALANVTRLLWTK